MFLKKPLKNPGRSNHPKPVSWRRKKKKKGGRGEKGERRERVDREGGRKKGGKGEGRLERIDG